MPRRWKADRIKFVLCLILTLAVMFIGASGTVYADMPECSLDTLHGVYLFHAQGVILDGDDAFPYTEAGLLTLDGAGKGEGIFSAGLNGATIANRESFTVTYEVINGCAFAAYAPIDEEVFEFHFFASPTGDMIVYYADSFNGTMWRQPEPESLSHVDQTIANALSAAPAPIAAEAAVLDWPTAEKADFTELRAGTNGWTCVPDDPATPTNDPMCLDEQWLEWLTAFVEGRDPEITTWGWAYMLQGGSAASDTDPALTEPPEGADWLVGPPHLMLIGPEPFNTSLYVTNRNSGQPYLMWAGTPYEHFMIPVQFDIPAATDDPVANALSAAPDNIAAEAAVLDWPNAENAEFAELRAGTNGWSCFPDDPATPANDPQCFDAQWLEWLTAFFEGRDPEITAVGFSYMLQGGSSASDADPFLMEPPDSADWLVGPPHVMMIAPDAFDASAHPTHRDSGAPYIMWAGTSYEHFMAPSQLDGH